MLALTPRPRPWSRWVIAALVALSVATTPSSADADDRDRATAPAAGDPSALPTGWSVEGDPRDGAVLVWRNGDVRVGGGRPELRLGDELLGFAREVGRTLRLPISSEQLAAIRARPRMLQAWSGGRRLDGPDRAAPSGASDVGPGAPAVPVAIDPARTGRFETRRLHYDVEPLVIDEYPEPVEVRAEVTRPLAPGRRPFVLLLHGRHSTCYRGGDDGRSGGQWPCPPAWRPIPSHLGYRYLTDVLASQGFIAVSISANGINGQDWASPDGGAAARSQLIRHHLGLWRRWNERGGDPWEGTFEDRVDLSRVTLVGHSRGGEGVNRAAIDAEGADGYRIRGLVSFGPTAFGRQVTPDVPSAVLLPACDGDVSDLQGQAYVDGSRDIAHSTALRSAVLALGANHNYFNTEWTPGLAQAPSFDDWYDPVDPICGKHGRLRLTKSEQQDVGAAYTLALVRMVALGDDEMVPLLDGSKVKPRSIGAAQVSVSPVGGAARRLYRPEAPGTPQLSLQMIGRECRGYTRTTTTFALRRACGEGYSAERTPHWQPMGGGETSPSPEALELEWSDLPAVARFPLTGETDLHRFDSIDVRVANDPKAPPSGLAVRVHDALGHSALLGADLETVADWPGTRGLARIQARTVRASLARAPHVDLARITSFDLVATSDDGHAWVLDAHAVRHGRTRPHDLHLPAVSVGTVEVVEGGPGDQTTAEVPVRVHGTLRRDAKVWLQVQSTDGIGGWEVDGHPLDLPAGASGRVATVPLQIEGDDVYEGGDLPLQGGMVVVSARRGAVTRQYIGGATVIEDEDAPVLSAVDTDVVGTEGDSLLWDFRLSGPTTGAFYSFVSVPPTSGTELDSDDVDQDWLREQLLFTGIDLPFPIDPPLPLSEIGTGLALGVSFDGRATEATLEVPLRVDRTAEGDEVAAFEVEDEWGDPTIPPEGVRIGGQVLANTETTGIPDWEADAVVIDGGFGDSPAEEAAIDSMVTDAPVVLAGQASRGAGELIDLRTGLVADLAERGGLTDVLLDEPLPTSLAAARYVALGTGSAEAAVEAFGDELRRTEEAMTLLEALRVRNAAAPEPVLLLGIGPGDDPSALVDVVEAHDVAAAAELACFDLGPIEVTTWHSRPDGEQAACRSELIDVREDLALDAAAAGRDAAGVTAALAHAAAAALVSAEWSAEIDPAGAGAADDVASRRAEVLAEGILAARTREPTGRIVALLDDLDAGVLRDVAEPRIVPTTEPEPPPVTTVEVRASTGALLVDVLGPDEVAPVGFLAGAGEIRAYSVFGDTRSLDRQRLDQPMRGTTERRLSAFGPEGAAFALPLAGQAELAAPALTRIGIRDEYDSWQPDAWWLPVGLTAAFDGVVHVRSVTSTVLLADRPVLEIDGTPVDLGTPCYDDEGIAATFTGGTLHVRQLHDSPTGPAVDVTIVTGGHIYEGVVPLTEDDGLSFSGVLESVTGGSITIDAFLPWDLASC